MAGGENGPPVLSGAEYVFPKRNLGQLRTALLERLGFFDPMANAPKRSLATIRTDVLTELGFPDPITAVTTRSLVLLREDVIRRLGYYYAATLPDGMAALVNGFINSAQQTAWRRLELDKGGEALPTFMAADGDLTNAALDFMYVQILAIAMAKAHYRQPDAELYLKQFEQLLVDTARRRPPNVSDIVTKLIQQAQETIIRRYEVGTRIYAVNNAFTADADLTTIDYWPVQALATGLAKARYEQKDARTWLDITERWFNDLAQRQPPNAVGMCNAFLKDANTQMYWRYPVARNKRWFSIATLATGERFYDLPSIVDGSIEFRRVEWVGYQSGDAWYPMQEGIHPIDFTNTTAGFPLQYQIGRYLEIWPPPNAVYTIWLYGALGLVTFEDDSDEPSVDDHAVFLRALANAKAHFKQPDAGMIERQADELVGRYVAATHTGKRYIPGMDPYPVVPLPRVTFSRP